jgi:hypothetical protein
MKENQYLRGYLLSVRTLIDSSTIFGVLLLVVAFSLGLILHGIWRSIKYNCQLSKEDKNSMAYNNKVYLVATHCDKLSEYFSARAALWGSSIVGLVASLFVAQQYWQIYVILIGLFYFMYDADIKKERKIIERTCFVLDKKNNIVRK